MAGWCNILLRWVLEGEHTLERDRDQDNGAYFRTANEDWTVSRISVSCCSFTVESLNSPTYHRPSETGNECCDDGACRHIGLDRLARESWLARRWLCHVHRW